MKTLSRNNDGGNGTIDAARLLQRSPFLLAIGALLCAAGCQSYRAQQELNAQRILHPRVVVPAPYEEPPSTVADDGPRYSHYQSTVPIDPQTPIPAVVEPPIPALPTPVADWLVARIPEFEPPVLREPALPVDELVIKRLESPMPLITKIHEPPTPRVETPTSLPKVDVKPIVYKVERGESFWKIGKKFGVSYKYLAAYNNLELNKPLAIGATLKIPPGGATHAPRVGKPPLIKSVLATGFDRGDAKERRPRQAHTRIRVDREKIPAAGKYIVQPSDSLWKISRKFGVSIENLREFNDLDDDDDILRIGQMLLLRDSGGLATTPAERPKPPRLSNTSGGDEEPPAETTVEIEIPDNLQEIPHYVDEGDTLQSIAEMYGSEVLWIIHQNASISSEDSLKPGMRINVPFLDLD